MLALPGSAYLYQGEELGLPEHTTLPDDAPPGPDLVPHRRSSRSAATAAACRSRGRRTHRRSASAPTDKSWLPQPPAFGELALDRQRGVPGSTYELYVSALRLRREHGLGHGDLSWLTTPGEVVAFQSGNLLVLTNFGPNPAELPAGAEVLLASEPVAGREVPTDVTVWARLA